MKHKIPFFTILLLCSVCTVSCSIREERSECPTFITIYTPTDADCLVSFYGADSTLLVRTHLTADEVSTGLNWTPVPRGDFFVSVCQALTPMSESGDRTVACAPDSASAAVYAMSRRLFVTGDDYTVTDSLCKQYAHVRLTFADPEGNGTNPYDVRLVAPSRGLDLVTLRPAPGMHSFALSLDADLRTEFNLLRQRDGDVLLLEYRDPETATTATDIRLSDFIARAGYSWSAPELPDMDILVDCVRAVVTISVAGWEESKTYSFVI